MSTTSPDQCRLAGYAITNRLFLRVALLFTIALSVFPSRSIAQAPQESLKRAVVNIDFALSGAISNGSYQAGVMSAIIAYLKTANDTSSRIRSSNRFRLRAAAGASAGAINSLAVPLMWCDSLRLPLSESVLWRAWIPVGLSQLFSDGNDAGSVFSRKYFQERLLPPIEAKLRSTTCSESVFIAATLTRVVPDTVAIGSSGITVPQQRAVAAFELGSRGLQLSSANFLQDPSVGSVVVVDDSSVHQALTQIVLASSAFPVAFSPVKLKLIGVADSVRFLDGGVFDNNPLPVLRRFSEGQGDDSTWTLSVTPGLRDSTPSGVPTESTASELAQLMRPLLGVVPTGRAYELSILLRSRSDTRWLEGTLRTTQRREPNFGSTLGSFGAFLSRSFREYDFIAGVSDGLRFAARAILCARDKVSNPVNCKPQSRLVDSVAADIATTIPEISSDEAIQPLLRVLLTTAIEARSVRGASFRDSLLTFYAQNVRLLDGEKPGRSTSGYCNQNPGQMCRSGLAPLLRLAGQRFGNRLKAATHACTWERNAMKWADSSSCTDDGFVEALQVAGNHDAYRRVSNDRYLDFRSWIDDPELVLDLLVSKSADRALAASKGGRPDFQTRSIWWAYRSVVRSRTVDVNPTNALGARKRSLYFVPYGVGTQLPLSPNRGALVHRLTMYSSQAFSRKIGGALEFGAENARAVSERDSAWKHSVTVSLALAVRVPAVSIHVGALSRCQLSSWPCKTGMDGRKLVGNALPIYVRATLLNALSVGVEYGDGVAGMPTSEGARISIGVTDLRGLWWLLYPKRGER